MMVMMIIPANRGDRDRAASRDDDNGGDDDGDDAANRYGDDDHGGHLCRIASHVGTGSWLCKNAAALRWRRMSIPRSVVSGRRNFVGSFRCN